MLLLGARACRKWVVLLAQRAGHKAACHATVLCSEVVCYTQPRAILILPQFNAPGKGAFGVVRLALDKKTGQMYACKSISKARAEGLSVWGAAAACHGMLSGPPCSPPLMLAAHACIPVLNVRAAPTPAPTLLNPGQAYQP